MSSRDERQIARLASIEKQQKLNKEKAKALRKQEQQARRDMQGAAYRDLVKVYQKHDKTLDDMAVYNMLKDNVAMIVWAVANKDKVNDLYRQLHPQTTSQNGAN